jgi:hypothetical protein
MSLHKITYTTVTGQTIKVYKAAADKFGIKNGQKGVPNDISVKCSFEHGRIDRGEVEPEDKKP